MGYSRAIRVGRFVLVSGTTATAEEGTIVGKGDPYAQAIQALKNLPGVAGRSFGFLSLFAVTVSSAEGIPKAWLAELAMLEAKARIYSRKYKDGAVEMEVEAPASVVRRVREWVVKSGS